MVKLTLQACLASIAVSFVLFPGMASAQDDETIDYFIRPPEELNLDSELEDAISRTIRTFNAELTNTGRFRQRADMEMQSVISSCIDDSSSNPDAARNCTIMQANLLQIQYIIEFWMDDFGGDEYQLSLTLWNTETSANEATFVEDIEADSAVRAARTAMPILASHVIGRFSSPAYLEVTSMSPSSGVSLTINGRPADPPRAGGRIETFPGTLELVATANGYGPWTRT
ncbi:MAG: hypothetical protein KDA28_02750, partial [Phycisphaerales bacterium]|nr:hypothetical protein [Phycisphaerales bacterium]